LSSEDLKSFHSSHITTGNCTLFLSGEIKDEDYKLIYALTDHIKSASASKVIPENLIVRSSDQRIMRIAGTKNQCSIKMGRLACKRADSEYLGLLYLSTVLGGYFGSRLVTNLREEKGITYGIYSTIDALLYDGLMLISTEVANDQVELCVREIYREMDRLKHDKISSAELQTVNNYLMGHFINLFDGPFNSIRAIKSLVLNSISLDTLSSLFEESISFDENSIQALAQKYLNREDFWEITVGMVE
jgi:predicted Zn-dependent peptidase